MDKGWSKQLAFIRESRAVNRKNIRIATAAILLLQVLSLIPGVVILTGPLIFSCVVIVFVSMTKAARIKCPRCRKGFGTNWIIAFGIGNNNCQSCDLNLYSDLDEHNQAWK